MPESVRQGLPPTHSDDHIRLGTSADQSLLIRKAAELIGWSVSEYVLSAALDRAERDLYEHAAASEHAGHVGGHESPAGPRSADVRSSGAGRAGAGRAGAGAGHGTTGTGAAEPFVAVVAALG